MYKEEDIITSLGGKRQPFTVPDGYFDGLAERVMSQPAIRQTAKERPAFRRLWYAAAAVVLLLLAPVFWMKLAQPADSSLAQDTSIDTYFDEIADYAMVDNYDVYACLTSE